MTAIATAIALGLVESRSLDLLLAGGAPEVAACADALGWPEVPPGLGDAAIDRVHLGSEFCETLLPGAGQLRHALDRCGAAGLGLALVTPILSDAGLARLSPLLALLPAAAEVVANDWGTLRLLRRTRPDLIAVAGRLLCKMIKDPRLPSPEWARLYPHGLHSAPFSALLERLGAGRVEMDVPPFAEPRDFRFPTVKVSVHAPYGFSVKGRSCRIGSLAQPSPAKFTAGQDCRRECLIYGSGLSRPDTGAADLPGFQRGNTQFYRHSAPMRATVAEAMAAGWVDRLVLSGDWHENRRPH